MDDQNQQNNPRLTPDQSMDPVNQPVVGSPVGPSPQPQPRFESMAPAPAYQPGVSSVRMEYNQPVIARRSRKKIWLLGLGLFVVALGTWSFLGLSSKPDGVFNDFLAQSLQTKLVTQSFTQGDNSITVIYDVSNVKDPKVSSKATLGTGATKFSVEGYGTLQNCYLKFTKVEPGDPAADKTVGKWVQLREGGTLAGGDSPYFSRAMLLLFGSDPRHLALGDVIFGNFSAADRGELLKLMSDKKVFDYDSSKVIKERLDGHDVYVYTTKTKKDALKEVNKKAAKIMGIPDADLENALSEVDSSPASAKLFVRIDTKQLVRVEVEEGLDKMVNVYSEYDSSKLPSEPKPTITYDAFAQAWSTF